MSGKSRWIYTAMVAAFMLVVSACGQGGVSLDGVFGETESPPPLASCLLVVDRTGSTEASVGIYTAAAEKALEGCADLEAEIAVYTFAQSGQKIESVGQIRNLRPAEGQDPRLLVNRAEQLIDDAMEREAGEARASDILTAFDNAARNLRNNAAASGVEGRYLIMITDGVQIGSQVNLASTVEGSDPAESVELTRSLGLVPDLSGVEVTMVGVKGGQDSTGQQLPQWFETYLEGFWTMIISEGGGELCLYVADADKLPGRCG